MTTNGLIGTHFIPAANDHGMPTTVAAGLLATIGILDVAGTVFSGWLTDRVDPRLLLVVYYAGRGISLLLLPSLLSPHAEPSTWVFVIFYGLDWVATVPPTIVLCRNYFGTRSPVVFGWVFASHQLGAAIAAAGAGWLRDLQGDYDMAFYLAAGLCCRRRAAMLSCNVRKRCTGRAARFAGAPTLCLGFTRRCGLGRAGALAHRARAASPLRPVATRPDESGGATSEDSHQQGAWAPPPRSPRSHVATTGDQRLCRTASRSRHRWPRSPIRRGRAATPSRQALPSLQEPGQPNPSAPRSPASRTSSTFNSAISGQAQPRGQHRARCSTTARTWCSRRPTRRSPRCRPGSSTPSRPIRRR